MSETTMETQGSGAMVFDAGEAKGKVDREAARQAILPTLRAAAFGEIMSLLMQSPRHQNVSIGSVARKMVPAFLTQQYVIAKAKPDDAKGPPAPVGFAFWAAVSDEVDRKLVQELDKPLELSAEDWTGGDNIWLLDMVAPSAIGPSIIKEIQAKVGTGKPIKMRVAGPDGVPRVKTLEPVAGAPEDSAS